MKKMLFISIILPTFFFASCEKEEVNASTQLIISNGQSFGFCVGPCYHEIIIQGTEIKLKVISRDVKDNSVVNTETIYTETFSKSEQESLIQIIDNEQFMKLDSVYGCPDCADGGSEWIGIQDGEKKHKVTFEYGKSVKGIEKLVTLLREKRLQMSEKYVK